MLTKSYHCFNQSIIPVNKYKSHNNEDGANFKLNFRFYCLGEKAEKNTSLLR